MNKKIGDYIKDLRKDLRMTLEEFSEVIGLSKSYINQIEKNERVLSKKKLFETIYYFNQYQKIDPPLPTNEMLKVFANQKSLNIDTLQDEYYEFETTLQEKQKNATGKFSKKMDSISENKIEYPTNHNKDIKEIDKPLFDLEWLLSQDEYHLFYGRKYHTDTSKVHTDTLDKLTYNKLSEEDKKMIKKVIEAIFENKYNKYNLNNND